MAGFALEQFAAAVRRLSEYVTDGKRFVTVGVIQNRQRHAIVEEQREGDRCVQAGTCHGRPQKYVKPGSPFGICTGVRSVAHMTEQMAASIPQRPATLDGNAIRPAEAELYLVLSKTQLGESVSVKWTEVKIRWQSVHSIATRYQCNFLGKLRDALDSPERFAFTTSAASIRGARRQLGSPESAQAPCAWPLPCPPSHRGHAQSRPLR
jgi:hypothetical protein